MDDGGGSGVCLCWDHSVRYWFTFLCLLAAFSLTVAPTYGQWFGKGAYGPALGSPPTPTPGPQALLSFGGMGNVTVPCPTSSPFTTNKVGLCAGDPGARADQSLFYGYQGQSQNAATSTQLVQTNGCNPSARTATSNLADTSGNHCGFYLYVGLTHYNCDGTVPEAYWWGNVINAPHQAGALHFNSANGDRSGNITLANMMVNNGESGQCNSAGTGSGGTGTVIENPNDTTEPACVVTFLTTSNTPCNSYATGPFLSFPAGEGMGLDYGWVETGNTQCIKSTEFGNTLAWATPQNGHGTTPCMTAFADLYNNLSPVPIVAKQYTGGADGCMTSTAPALGSPPAPTPPPPNCYPTTFSDAGAEINSRWNMDAFCAAIGSNFQGELLEELTSRTALTQPVITVLLNTFYYQQTTHVCPNMRWMLEEFPVNYYNEQMGILDLMPDALTGVPDLGYAYREVDGSTPARWVDQEIVPANPEQTLTTFAYTTITNGSVIDNGCSTGATNVAPSWGVGNTGGTKPINVWCVSQRRPVLCLQYVNVWILSTNYGKGVVCVNEGATNETVQSAWFPPGGSGDPASTYGWTLNVEQEPGPSANVAIGGTITAGDTVTTTINNHATTYTVTSGDVSGGASTLATNIAANINADATDGPIVTATGVGSKYYVVADTHYSENQYPFAVTSTGTETYTPNDVYLVGTPATGSYIPVGYNGSLLGALQDVNTACAATNSNFCVQNVATALQPNTIPFNPSPTAGTCDNNAYTCLPAHTAKWFLQGSGGSTGTFVYRGCGTPVQVFNATAGTPDAIMNKDISGASVDANSASVMAAFGTTTFANQIDNSSVEIVNCAGSGTATHVVQHASGGHTPPISSNPNEGLGGTGASMHWISTFKAEGGTCPMTGVGSGDCHMVVLYINGPTVTDEECGGQENNNSFIGSTLTAYSCSQSNLNDTYTNNWLPSGGTYGNNTGDSGICWLCTIVWGEEMNDTSINHPLNLIFPRSMMPQFGWGHGATGANISVNSPGADGSCTTGPSGCFLYGDLLRLKPGVSCGSNAQAILVCNALKKYGGYPTDTAAAGSSPEIRFGQSTNGTDPFQAGLFTWIHGLSLNNFEIVDRTTTIP